MPVYKFLRSQQVMIGATVDGLASGRIYAEGEKVTLSQASAEKLGDALAFVENEEVVDPKTDDPNKTDDPDKTNDPDETNADDFDLAPAGKKTGRHR